MKTNITATCVPRNGGSDSSPSRLNTATDSGVQPAPWHRFLIIGNEQRTYAVAEAAPLKNASKSALI